MAHLERVQLKTELTRGVLRLTIFGINVVGIPQDPDARHRRRDLLEELEPLRGQVGGDQRDTGDVSARAGETRDHLRLYWIVAHRHHDGNRARRRARERCDIATESEDQVWPALHELGSQPGKPLGFGLRVAVLVSEVASLDVPEITHAVAKRRQVRIVVGRAVEEHSDARHLARLGARAARHQRKLRHGRGYERTPGDGHAAIFRQLSRLRNHTITA